MENTKRRKDMIDLLVQKIVKLCLSDVDRHFIWAATVKEGVFKFTTMKKGKSIKSYNILELNSAVTEVFDSISTSKSKKETLSKIQKQILKSKKEFQKELQEFIEVKNRLIDKAKQLTNITQSQLLTLLSTNKTVDLLLWIDEVTLLTILETS